jgi:hypothetical protein
MKRRRNATTKSRGDDKGSKLRAMSKRKAFMTIDLMDLIDSMDSVDFDRFHRFVDSNGLEGIEG